VTLYCIQPSSAPSAVSLAIFYVPAHLAPM